MSLYEKGKFKIGEDILDLAYIRGVKTEEQIKSIIREKANQGLSFVRVFNAHKDTMLFADYNQAHWDLLEKRLRYLIDPNTCKVMLTPIIDVTGYARLSLQKLTQSQWEVVTFRLIPLLRDIFCDNFIISPGNEITKAPNTFKYVPKKPGMAGQMEKLGAWTNHMTQIFIDQRVPKENVFVNVVDNDAYPAVPSTGDMMIGADNSNMGAGGIVDVNNVIASYHKIHFGYDIKLAAKRIWIAKRLWKYHLTNDGKSASGHLGDGVDPSCRQDGNFKNVSNNELYNTTVVAARLAKKGVGKHKIGIWFADLFREHYSHNITFRCVECGAKFKKYLHVSEPRPDTCPKCGGKVEIFKCEVVTDWNYIDMSRSEKMAQAVISVYGKNSLPNRGKFPAIEDDVEIEVIPDGEPIEEITTEVIMKLTLTDKIKKYWNENKLKFIGVVIVCGLAIWKVLEIIFWK